MPYVPSIIKKWKTEIQVEFAGNYTKSNFYSAQTWRVFKGRGLACIENACMACAHSLEGKRVYGIEGGNL